MSQRVSFLIDGFNLYHSICDAIKDHSLAGGKWLDISSLCQGYIHLISTDAIVQDVFYFSALATHTSDPQAPMRHKALIAAMESVGVKTVLGKFKKKWIKCRAGCGQSGWGYEEKETDVNIAVTLMELFLTDRCDTAIIISGDTDLATAVIATKRLFPNKKVGFCFPYKRANKELRQLAHFSFKIDASQYQQHVFPNPVTLSDGSVIMKPPSW